MSDQTEAGASAERDKTRKEKSRDARRPPPIDAPIHLRPSRSDAEDHGDKFAELFAFFKGNTLDAKTLARITGAGESTMARYRKHGNYPPEYRKPILNYLFSQKDFLLGETRQELDEIEDALYFAFLNYIDVKETSQDNARARVVGTYRLWRYSVEHSGEFVCGRITFWEDPITRALKVEMLQPKRDREDAPGGKVRGSIERGSGYLFRVSHMYLMLISDVHTFDVRMTIFPRVKMDMVGKDVNRATGEEEKNANPRCQFEGASLHIVQMDGFALGIDGSTGFFSPVHLSLVDDIDELAGLEANLDVLPEQSIPKRVAEKLRQNGPMRRL